MLCYLNFPLYRERSQKLLILFSLKGMDKYLGLGMG